MLSQSDTAVAGTLGAGDTALLLASLEQAPVAMAVVEGPEHRYRYVNAAFRALPTAPRPQPGGRLADGFPGLADGLEEVRRSGRQTRVSDLVLAGADGRTRVWDVDCAPLAGSGGAHSVLITMHDVSAKAEALKETEGLLREVNHRVKNSLQLVSSLLTLQALSAKDAELRRQFQEACGRIGTIAQVHQRLYQSQTYSEVAFGAYLRDLCRELGGSAAAAGRTIAVQADDVDLPADTVIPLALVVNELVSNAVKYAYAEGEGGEVAVGFHVQPDGRKSLTVADHGRGLPEGYDVARADTLGMKVVRAFTGQLKGKFRAEPNVPGTRFVVDLPA
ncbi:MAG TPA: histidine kinase dimerization/phosphoacceptor domain -containing protein [Azospirillum sp.]|nr:histidine kinase dimerization/phosphoacceptor domain -containing protein [Azospirillum sp.]